MVHANFKWFRVDGEKTYNIEFKALIACPFTSGIIVSILRISVTDHFPLCSDYDYDCARLPQTLCTAMEYRSIAATACRKFCGFCQGLYYRLHIHINLMIMMMMMMMIREQAFDTDPVFCLLSFVFFSLYLSCLFISNFSQLPTPHPHPQEKKLRAKFKCLWYWTNCQYADDNFYHPFFFIRTLNMHCDWSKCV